MPVLLWRDQVLHTLVLIHCRYYWTRSAGGGGAPQASNDKRRHRNCFQTRPLHAHNHFQKSKHLLGSEVSWCNHRLAQTPKEAFSEVRVHPGTTQVDFEVDRPPPADSPPGDLLITIVKEAGIIYKKYKNEKKWDLFVSLIDLIMMKTPLTVRLPVTVKLANVVVGLWKEIFARTHTATHKPTSAQCLIVTTMTHLIIVCGADRPTAWWGNKLLFSPCSVEIVLYDYFQSGHHWPVNCLPLFSTTCLWEVETSKHWRAEKSNFMDAFSFFLPLFSFFLFFFEEHVSLRPMLRKVMSILK